VQAGGVERSMFCLFSLLLPARCVSSISPRFHYRRHAFCFLPLATILESLSNLLSCERPTLLTEINTGLEWKAGCFIKLMAPENRQE
jgi:hypothetical protein